MPQAVPIKTRTGDVERTQWVSELHIGNKEDRRKDARAAGNAQQHARQANDGESAIPREFLSYFCGSELPVAI